MRLKFKTSFAELEIKFSREVTEFHRPVGKTLNNRQGTACEVTVLGTDKYYIGYAIHNPSDLYSQEVGEKKALREPINYGLTEDFKLSKEQRKEIWDGYFRERAKVKYEAAKKEYERLVVNYETKAEPPAVEQPITEALVAEDPYNRWGGMAAAAKAFSASRHGYTWHVPKLELNKNIKTGEWWISSVELSPVECLSDFNPEDPKELGRIQILEIPF